MKRNKATRLIYFLTLFMISSFSYTNSSGQLLQSDLIDQGDQILDEAGVCDIYDLSYDIQNNRINFSYLLNRRKIIAVELYHGNKRVKYEYFSNKAGVGFIDLDSYVLNERISLKSLVYNSSTKTWADRKECDLSDLERSRVKRVLKKNQYKYRINGCPLNTTNPAPVFNVDDYKFRYTSQLKKLGESMRHTDGLEPNLSGFNKIDISDSSNDPSAKIKEFSSRVKDMELSSLFLENITPHIGNITEDHIDAETKNKELVIVYRFMDLGNRRSMLSKLSNEYLNKGGDFSVNGINILSQFKDQHHLDEVSNEGIIDAVTDTDEEIKDYQEQINRIRFLKSTNLEEWMLNIVRKHVGGIKDHLNFDSKPINGGEVIAGDSPLISLSEDPRLLATTSDPVMKCVIHGVSITDGNPAEQAPHLAAFVIPRSLLTMPTTEMPINETEVLYHGELEGEWLMKYYVGHIDNPYENRKTTVISESQHINLATKPTAGDNLDTFLALYKKTTSSK